MSLDLLGGFVIAPTPPPLRTYETPVYGTSQIIRMRCFRVNYRHQVHGLRLRDSVQCSVHVQCTCAVYMCSVHVQCTCAVYMCSVHVQCTCAVYMCSVHVQCTCAVYMCSVLVQCTCAVHLVIVS